LIVAVITSIMAEPSGSADEPLDQTTVLRALERLTESLKELNDKESAPALSHYRHPPADVAQSYNLFQQGAALVYGTSTKYTLLGKIDELEQAKLTQDLLNGCQLIGTACLVLHDDSTGCSASLRHHAKQAARGIVTTVQQLVQSFVDGSALVENVGAQKTGAVWQTCNVVLEKKLPIGNRSSMRRDWLTDMADCNETVEEFQELIDAGPELREEDEEGQETNTPEKDDDDAFEDFMGGQDQLYSSDEIPIATACVFLVKCSRGGINATEKTCEAVGKQLAENNNSKERSSIISDNDKALLAWISKANGLAHAVGEGMTDLGAVLYPTLELETVQSEVERQSSCIDELLSFLLNASPEGMDGSLDLPQDVVELVAKVNSAVEKRRAEVGDAITAALNNQ
jgi:hypothetical protein